jgi:hypothetical protein
VVVLCILGRATQEQVQTPYLGEERTSWLESLMALVLMESSELENRCLSWRSMKGCLERVLTMQTLEPWSNRLGCRARKWRGKEDSLCCI